MKHPTSNSPLCLLHSFLGLFCFALVFSPSRVSVRNPCTFEYANSLRHHIVSCPSFLVWDRSSAWVPSSTAQNPSTSCTRLGLLHSGPLFSPCHVLPYAFYPPVLSQPSFTLTLPWHFHLFAASSTSHETIFACSRIPLHSMFFCFRFLIQRRSLLFWLWFEIVRILPCLHRTEKDGRVLPCSIHLLSCLLIRDGSYLRHSSSVNNRSLFCWLVCLRSALMCLTSTKMPS